MRLTNSLKGGVAMRRSPSVIVTILGLSMLVGTVALAAPASGERPHRYLPGGLDSGLVVASAPDTNQTWAAWSYRNGAEFDIALSVVGTEGLWSEPIFLGLDDGADQTRPVLVSDRLGRFHVVFEDARGRIRLSSLTAGGSWSAPVAISEPHLTATEPVARVIGDRLVIAYRAAGTIRLLDLPIDDDTVSGRGLNDGPDPVENGRSGEEENRRKKRNTDHRGVRLGPIDMSVPTDLTLLPLLGNGRKIPDTP